MDRARLGVVVFAIVAGAGGACNVDLDQNAHRPATEPVVTVGPVAGSGAPFPVAPPISTVTPVATLGASNTPLIGPTVVADKAPPPISGGTLLTTHDGLQLVAADPDRDQVYFVDIASESLSQVRKLMPGDEPGRLVEDSQGRIHVALRSARSIATLSRDPDGPIVRREVCDVPRGIAYDAKRDLLHVACAEGRVVSLPAAPEGAIARTIQTRRDVRDVIVRGDELFVSRFREATLDRYDSAGSLLSPVGYIPPRSQQPGKPVSTSTSPASGASSNPMGSTLVDSTPTTAWRTIDVPGRGTVMLHQRASNGEILVTTPGGYGTGGACGPGIVKSSITVAVEGDKTVSADLVDASVAVDIAIDPEGVLLAVASPGNFDSSRQVALYSFASDRPLGMASASAGQAPVGGVSTPTVRCLPADRSLVAQSLGQVTAVSFASPWQLAIQEREPAAISLIDVRTGELLHRIDLGQPSRYDTGHAMFHMRTNSGMACASCHAEAGEDAHVWTFNGIGPRRTQSLRGGILGTEPLHWNGDMPTFPKLVTDVMVGRMGSLAPTPDKTDALSRWIDAQPALSAHASDPAAAERGKVLFESPDIACASCHNGPHLTDNKTVDVGTGALLQVPSLRGVSFRTPLMHTGCAATLEGRFDPACGGNDLHGHTSQLQPAQRADLISYLETL